MPAPFYGWLFKTGRQEHGRHCQPATAQRGVWPDGRRRGCPALVGVWLLQPLARSFTAKMHAITGLLLLASIVFVILGRAGQL